MKQRHLIATFFFALLTSGFGSCGNSIQEICVSRFPAYEEQFSSAIAALAPWDDSQGRALASDGAVVPLHSSDREAWRQWAQERLSETQGYLDIAADEPSTEAVRRELSVIANELVTFHGYASSGRAGRMIVTLKRIEASSSRIRQSTCSRIAQSH